MNLIDTHAHLYWDDYKPDLDQVIDRALEVGVDTAVIVGVDTTSSQKAIDFHHPKITTYATVGIHPHEAHKYFQNNELIHQDIAKLEQLIINNPDKVKAIGECGLDFLFTGNPDFQPSNISIEQLKHLQIELLQAQVDLAKKHSLPLVIHCREAWDEIFQYIGSHFGILHCYSGNEAITNQTLQTKFMISFAANITYPKNQYLRDAATHVPLDRIVLETDCPFLSPQSSRGKRNEPASVRQIAELIADLKNTTIEQIANQTTANTKSILKI